MISVDCHGKLRQLFFGSCRSYELFGMRKKAERAATRRAKAAVAKASQTAQKGPKVAGQLCNHPAPAIRPAGLF
jgi:hypothetical protein